MQQVSIYIYVQILKLFYYEEISFFTRIVYNKYRYDIYSTSYV